MPSGPLAFDFEARAWIALDAPAARRSTARRTEGVTMGDGPAYAEPGATWEGEGDLRLVPCLVDDASGPRIAALPSGEDTRAWFEGLAAELEGFPGTSPDDVILNPEGLDKETLDRWWSWFDGHGQTDDPADAPIERWADPVPESARPFLEVCTRVLGSDLLRFVVGLLKIDTDPEDGVGPLYPPSLGLFPTWRCLPERLFDRLHVNSYVLPTGSFSGGTWGGLTRCAGWWTSDATFEPPFRTLFGVRRDDCAYVRLRGAMAEGDFGGSLLSVLGMPAVPDSLSMPLMWSEARSSGVADGLVAAFPAQVVGGVEGLAGTVHDLAEGATVGPVPHVLAALLGPLPLFATLAAGRGLAHGRALLRKVEGALLEVAESTDLRAAAEAAIDLVYELDYESVLADLDGVGLSLDTSSLLLGLGERDLVALMRAVSVDTMENPYAEESATSGGLDYQITNHEVPEVYNPPPPMVLLGPEIMGYASEFSGFVVDPAPAPWEETGTTADRLIREWIRLSAPAREAAMACDALGRVLEQLVYLDDVLLAMADVALSEGIVGNLLRTTFHDLGVDYLTDVLGGASIGQVLRFLVRQFYSDLYIEAMVDRGADRDCLHWIFCWMRTEEARARIEAALGPLRPIEDVVPAASLLALALPPEVGPLFVRDYSDSALGRLVSAIVSAMASAAASGGQAAEVLGAVKAAIEPADLCALRAWMESARPECLPGMVNAVRAGLTPQEPNDLPENEVDVDLQSPELGAEVEKTAPPYEVLRTGETSLFGVSGGRSADTAWAEWIWE